MPTGSRDDLLRVRKGVAAALRQGARLHALFVLALPSAGGVLLLYGVYDSVRMHAYHNALVVSGIAALFFCPIVLAVLAEHHQRKFILWLENNVDALAAGTATYRGARVSADSEVITFDLAFSVVVASFKIPSQMFIVGQHRIWPWRFAYVALSALFGWWGIPWGPIYTIQALHANVTAQKRQRLLAMIGVPGWEGGSASFGALLPKN